MDNPSAKTPPNPSPTRKCPACGARIAEDATSCPICGDEFASPATDADAGEQPITPSGLGAVIQNAVGRLTPPGTDVVDEVGDDSTAPTRECDHCGANAKTWAAHCPVCRQPLPPLTPSTLPASPRTVPPQPKARRSRLWWGIALGAGVGLVLAGAAIGSQMNLFRTTPPTPTAKPNMVINITRFPTVTAPATK